MNRWQRGRFTRTIGRRPGHLFLLATSLSLAVALTEPALAGPKAPKSAQISSTPPESPLTVSRTFGNWEYRCGYSGGAQQGAPAVCMVEQELRAHVKGALRALATVLLVRTADTSVASSMEQLYKLTLVTPLGFSLASPVTLVVDGSPPTSFAYETCTAAGCLSSSTVSPALLAQLQHGTTGHLHIPAMNGSALTINFGLSGLNAALDAVDAAVHPQASPRVHTPPLAGTQNHTGR